MLIPENKQNSFVYEKNEELKKNVFEIHINETKFVDVAK